jgi:hypothetical protein
MLMPPQTPSQGPAGHTEFMEYAGRVPAPPLDRFIDDIYCLTGVLTSPAAPWVA